MVYTDQAWARRRCTAAGSSPCAIGSPTRLPHSVHDPTTIVRGHSVTHEIMAAGELLDMRCWTTS
jgi:hypothetical protein